MKLLAGMVAGAAITWLITRRPATTTERPWILTQTGPFTRFGLSILGLIYDWQHCKDARR